MNEQSFLKQQNGRNKASVITQRNQTDRVGHKDRYHIPFLFKANPQLIKEKAITCDVP